MVKIMLMKRRLFVASLWQSTVFPQNVKLPFSYIGRTTTLASSISICISTKFDLENGVKERRTLDLTL